MNASLLNPFDGDCPSVYDGAMAGTERTTCVSFNRWGTLLAAGTSLGHVIIWDFETRGVARQFPNDITSQPSAVNSVSWTRNGRKVLASIAIGVIVQCDVMSGSIEHAVCFPSSILGADQHPNDMSLCAICCDGRPPVLARLERTEAAVTIVIDSLLERPKAIPKCVRFNGNGDALFIGWSQSCVTKHDVKSLQLLASICFPGNVPHVRINLGPNDDALLVTSNDRIRICDAQTLQIRKELSDVVNRTLFHASCLSNNGEYVAAGSLHKNSSHSVYIWNAVDGSLFALLDGTSAGIVSLHWHPTIPLLLACIKSEEIVSWSKNVNENWKAFAPDFVELHENVVVKDEEEESSDADINERSMDNDDVIDIGTRSVYSLAEGDDLKHIPVSPSTV